MTNYANLMILGWIFLISSWILPYVIKDKSRHRLAGIAMSGIAVCLFVLAFIIGFC